MAVHLNLNTVIRRIESRLGLSHQIMELSKEDILEIVHQDTLPVFSDYYPYVINHEIFPHDKVPGTRSEYFIKSDLDVLGIEELITSNSTNPYNGHSNSYFMDPIAGKMSADASSAFMHPELFRFNPPNRIELIPENYLRPQGATLRLRVVHPPHLMTIPLSLREIFLDLAFFDVCLALYPIRYNYSNIATSFGNIEMFMEHLESAYDKREELLEKLHEDSLKYAKRRKVFIF